MALALSPRALTAQRVAADVSVGSMGPGLGIGIGLSRHFDLRVAGYDLALSHNGSYTDETRGLVVGYRSKATVAGASALLNWRPRGGSFHVTGGAFYNGIRGSFFGAPTAPYKYDAQKTFSVERMGTISGSAKYSSSVSPYFGLGLGNPLTHRLGFLFDAGVLYTGSPKVSMEGTGIIAPTANYAPVINSGITSFKWYPFVSFGFSYSIAGLSR